MSKQKVVFLVGTWSDPVDDTTDLGQDAQLRAQEYFAENGMRCNSMPNIFWEITKFKKKGNVQDYRRSVRWAEQLFVDGTVDYYYVLPGCPEEKRSMGWLRDRSLVVNWGRLYGVPEWNELLDGSSTEEDGEGEYSNFSEEV